MSFFKSLFSSSDIIKKGTDAIINTGDALFYTEEEKAQAAKENRTWYLELMKSLSPSAKSRRGIAWGILGMVSLLTVLSVACRLMGYAENATWTLELMDRVWSWPFICVVGFYFAPGLIPTGNTKK